jgi:hypothetical protein
MPDFPSWDGPERLTADPGWYDDEDRLGYEEGHVCCPDCGDEPDDHTLHRDGCRRIFPSGDPLEYLQNGPPWLPWPEEAAR